MATIPNCKKHKDCFANRSGKCICLKETDFGERDCPFFKNKDDVDMNEIATACKAYAATHE